MLDDNYCGPEPKLDTHQMCELESYLKEHILPDATHPQQNSIPAYGWIKKSSWKDNWELSAQRALTVTRYLSQRCLPEKGVRAVGCGESRPVVPNDSAANKAKNRRVEIVVHMR